MDSIFNLAVIIRAVDQLTGPAREMARAITNLDTMAERGRGMMEWGSRMSVAGALTEGAAGAMMRAIRGPIEVAAEFQEAMSLVRSVTNGITGEEFDQLRAQALELGAATTFSASQAAEGMGFLAKAGFSAQEQMAAMPAMLDLARAGAVELGLAADIASNILSGFGLEATEMTRVADVMVATFTTANTDIPMLGETMKYIAPVARAAGMSLEEAAAMAGLLGNAGIQASQAGTTLRSMLTRLAAPGGEAAKTLEALGISVADSQGNMRNIVELIGDVGAAIENLGTQQQLEIIGTVFGQQAAAGAAELLDQGIAISEYVDRLSGSAGRAAQVAHDMSDNYRGAQEEFAGAIETLNIVLGDMLLPHLTEITLWLAEVMSGFGQWVQANPTLAKIAMSMAAIAAFALAIVAPVLVLIGGFATMAGAGLVAISKVGMAFVWLAPRILAASGAVLGFAAHAAASSIAPFLSGVTALGAALAGRVVAGLRMAAVAARAFGLALLANPIVLIALAVAAAAYLIWQYWEPISAFFISLWGDVQTAFESFSNWLSGWWETIGSMFDGSFDWSSLIPSLDWGTVLTILDWASWLFPLRWLDFIPGFSWAGIIGAVLDWAAWVMTLDWAGFVDALDWGAALTVLDWASWLLPIRWLDFIPGFSWAGVIGAALDWAAWVTTLDWSAWIASLSWGDVLTALDWLSWVSPLRWLDFIPGFSWEGIITGALDWASYVASLDWAGFVPSFDWGAALAALDWASWVFPIRWLDFIPGFSWAGVIEGALDWAGYITGLDWGAWVATLSWGDVLAALDWVSWISPLRWLDFIPGFSWSELLGGVAAFEWSSLIPELDWAAIVPAMPDLDWSAVTQAMAAPFELAFGAIDVVWGRLRALFEWSPIEAISTAFGPIGETLVGIISGAADMAGAAWNRVTAIFSSSDAVDLAARDPASIERATAAAHDLATALESVAGVDLTSAQAGVNAVSEAAAHAIAQAGGIPAAAEDAIRSARSIVAGVTFFPEGVAMMATLAAGIRAGATAAVQAVRDTVQVMRDHLPHSPAKIGPLSDLHRVRFAETLAGAIQPGPAVEAVQRLTAGMAAVLAGMSLTVPAVAARMPGVETAGRLANPAISIAMPQIGVVPDGADGLAKPGGAGAAEGAVRVEVNFNPTVTMQGGAGGGGGGESFASREQMQALLRSMGHELVQLIEDELARIKRRNY